MCIERDSSQPDARAELADIAPPGTLSEAVVSGELLRGPLFTGRAVVRRVTLTHNDLNLVNDRPEVSFALRFATSAATGAMLAEIQGL